MPIIVPELIVSSYHEEKFHHESSRLLLSRYLQGLFIVLLITYVWAYLTYLHSQPPGNSTAYLQALPRSPNLTRQHFMRHAALRLVLLSILLAFITQAMLREIRAARYDLAVDVGGSNAALGAFIVGFSGARFRAGLRGKWDSWFNLRFPDRPRKTSMVVCRN